MICPVYQLILKQRKVAMKDKQIILTEATGSIGQALAEQLAKQGVTFYIAFVNRRNPLTP